MTIRHPRRTAHRRTICEVHKEIHDIIHEYVPDKDIRKLALQKIDDVHGMAKRMDRKLKEYAYHIAKKEWRGWDRVNPYRNLIMFYRDKRKLGFKVRDPYRLEAEDFKKGIKRDPKEGYLKVPEAWKNLIKKSS